MEGKLKAILRVSLALTMALSLGLLVAFPVSAANGILATFPEPGEFTFEVPDGVTSITIEAWGAGGGGGGSTNAGFLSGRCGAGGGGGAYASVTLPVTQGQDLRVVVGAGGIGVWGGDGDEGGSSFVTLITDVYDPPHDPLVLAAGGSGGTANTAGGKPPGGPGGQTGDSTGDYVVAGDPGEPGATCFTSVSGAGGAGAYGGPGGASQGGAYVTSDGNAGYAPGGGGGGARTSQFDGARPGGAGAPGKVVISTARTCPTITPTTAQYDLADPGQVTTTITWNDASSITSIHDGTAYLALGTHYTVSHFNGTATLTILNAYLAGKLTTVGDPVVLTITFDICTPIPFTITAIDTGEEECPCIEPTTAQYDLANPGDLTVTIDWKNGPVDIDCIWDGTMCLTEGVHYTVGSPLTILQSYLQNKLTTVTDSLTLTINFENCATSFTITAIDSSQQVCPIISPTTAEYDLASPNNVATTITWNDASSITSIHDGSGYLAAGTDYTVVGNTLTILNAYLAGKLTEAGDMVVLTINCDFCAIPLTITAIDSSQQVCPIISPTTAEYDLASPNNVATTITWNDATSITSIHDGSTYLASGTHYSVSGNTLTILNAYLAGTLTTVGDSVVLTITFDLCPPIPFTITAIDSSQQVCPTIWPTTAQYDLANPNNVPTTITWNDATSITSIHDGSTYLASGTHYSVSGNTLTIMNTYLAGKLTTAGQSVVLTITFDICPPIPFTITAIDSTGQICPTISPTTAHYDLAHPNDVTTTITWNDASSVTSVEDDVGSLPAGFHYTVVGNTLTIMNTYLAGKLTTVGDSVVLTITFDICAPVYLTIRAIDTELPVGLTGYPVNKLAVMAPWIVLGASIIVGASLLALKRRRRA